MKTSTQLFALLLISTFGTGIGISILYGFTRSTLVADSSGLEAIVFSVFGAIVSVPLALIWTSCYMLLRKHDKKRKQTTRLYTVLSSLLFLAAFTLLAVFVYAASQDMTDQVFAIIQIFWVVLFGQAFTTWFVERAF